MIFTILPLPPTTNHTYRHHGHTVYMTKEAKDWQNDAIILFKTLRGYEPTIVTCTYWLKRDRDVDGSHKIILDTMQKAGVMKNDSTIAYLMLSKYKIVSPLITPYVEVVCGK